MTILNRYYSNFKDDSVNVQSRNYMYFEEHDVGSGAGISRLYAL